MKKKVFALLLVGVLPMAAMAEDGDGPSTSGTVGSLTWKVEDRILTVSGNGAIPDYTDFYQTPWENLGFTTGKGAPAQAFVIEPGVTRVGDYAFAMKGCMALDIPDTVTSIGKNAFHYSGCNAGPNAPPMAFLNIPGSVKTIGTDAFNGFGAKKIALHCSFAQKTRNLCKQIEKKKGRLRG